MRKLIAFVFLLALIAWGCSGWSPSGSDSVMDVSGRWGYEGKATDCECNPSFCKGCHGKAVKDDCLYLTIGGKRIILQDREELTISDHIINKVMGTALSGTIKVYSGDFRCGSKQIDESGTTITISDYGKFDSEGRYTSILSLSSSKDSTVLCKVTWSITGTKLD